RFLTTVHGEINRPHTVTLTTESCPGGSKEYISSQLAVYSMKSQVSDHIISIEIITQKMSIVMETERIRLEMVEMVTLLEVLWSKVIW
ncbi:hypothetical protein ACQP3C_29015, partial [Escherichia coli]